ncbi:MAG: hypothetical protein KGJ10_01455 [Acidobacteriota bacterium]|nr:hypothetical protein [Acidobacteriota bacterium]MDE3043476.1 hypothetical protein [Acidobacteriota bacterium]
MSAKQAKVRVVVDGSNLATEGRLTPSWSQLNEAVDAFVAENPSVEVIVVADASFEHRVAANERAKFNEAVLAGDVVTPPAGAIGRGDAFILKIADRVDAVVLSNDSFQEFHDEYPWLFNEGRLVGGKPVRGIGWIFTPRNPVRNAKAARSTKKLSLTLPGGKLPEIGTTLTPVKVTKRTTKKLAADKEAEKVKAKDKEKEPAKPAKRAKRVAKSAEAAKAPEPVKLLEAPKIGASSKSVKKSVTPLKASSRATTKKRTDKPVEKATATKRASKSGVTDEPAATVALRRGRQPVNPQEVYDAFATGHKIGARVEGEVTAFTSHGAVIKVRLKGGKEMECYAPTASLAQPAPARARDVLKRGDARTFRLVRVDAERRIAELSLL